MKTYTYLLFFMAVIILNISVQAQSSTTIKDKRNGKEYKIINIGEAWWMAENLNIGKMINSNIDPENNGLIEKYCYDNSPVNCDVYGGLYRWNEAMQYLDINDICPQGWHIPSDEEWKELELAYGITKDVIDSIGWRGINAGMKMKNDTFFNVLLGGYADYSGFSSIGLFANFWSSTLHNEDSTSVFYRSIGKNYASVDRDINNKGLGLSIRCIKD